MCNTGKTEVNNALISMLFALNIKFELLEPKLIEIWWKSIFRYKGPRERFAHCEWNAVARTLGEAKPRLKFEPCHSTRNGHNDLLATCIEPYFSLQMLAKPRLATTDSYSRWPITSLRKRCANILATVNSEQNYFAHCLQLSKYLRIVFAHSEGIGHFG